MITVNELIYTLIAERRHATNGEIQQIIAHVAQRPVATYLIKMTLWLRQELEMKGISIPVTKLPSAQIHLLKRIYYDGQWPVGTTIEQFEADLHIVVQHAAVQFGHIDGLMSILLGLSPLLMCGMYQSRKILFSLLIAPIMVQSRQDFRRVVFTQFLPKILNTLSDIGRGN